MTYYLFLCLFCLIIPQQASAAIIINEVMANALDEDTGEFIELYNTGDEPVDVIGLKFTDGDATDVIQPFQKDGKGIIPPKGYGVILDSEYAGEYQIPDTAILLTTKNTTLGNGLTTNDPIILFEEEPEKPIDTYLHPFNPGNGISVEKIDPFKGDEPDNWKASRDASGSTPGRENSHLKPLPEPSRQLVIIGPDKITEYVVEIFQVELQANGEKDINWEGEVKIEVSVPSARLSVVSGKPDGNSLTLKLEDGSAEFQLIAATKETIQLVAQSVSEPNLKAGKTIAVVAKPIAPPPADVVINEIMHSPDTKAGQVEWIELYNRDSQPADLSEWLIADSRNKPVSIPSGTVIPPNQFLILTKDEEKFLASFPDVKYVVQIKLPGLNNTGDTVTLRSSTGKKIDEVKYESAGSIRGRSLERLDPNRPSAEIANWKLSIDLSGATPGRPNSVSALISSSKPDLRITPNPFNPQITPTHIKYRAPTDTKVTIKIFDSAGKLVKTLLEKREAGGEQTISWDGKDDSGKKVSVGLYICQIIAAGGKQKTANTATATVVIAEKL
ncbi:MAG: lamin tail domain-containing protein [Candidatus Poribacteria bacterium]